MNSQNILHILAPSRGAAVAAIVGDRAALDRLHHVLSETLETGSGGTFAAASDGEPFLLAVVLQPDMQSVQTSYADEVQPIRSEREQIPLHQVSNFATACAKALGMQDAFLQPPPRGKPSLAVSAVCSNTADGAP